MLNSKTNAKQQETQTSTHAAYLRQLHSTGITQKVSKRKLHSMAKPQFSRVLSTPFIAPQAVLTSLTIAAHTSDKTTGES